MEEYTRDFYCGSIDKNCNTSNVTDFRYSSCRSHFQFLIKFEESLELVILSTSCWVHLLHCCWILITNNGNCQCFRWETGGIAELYYCSAFFRSSLKNKS